MWKWCWCWWWGWGWGEITTVLLLSYQSMYSSCDTTALHVAVAALKVLGVDTRVRIEWKRTETPARLSTVHRGALKYPVYPRKALTTRRYPEYPAGGGSKERAPALEAMADDFYTDMRDEDFYGESTYDVTRMSQFSQVTTKIPPSLDGKTS